MGRLITLCVLLFHLGLAASFPFPDGYNIAYQQPVQQYQYPSFSQPQRAIQLPRQHYSNVAYQNANPSYENRVAYPNSYSYPATSNRPNYGYMYETRHDPVVAQVQPQRLQEQVEERIKEHQAYNEQLANQIRLQNNKQQVHTTSEPYVNSASVQSHALANSYNNIQPTSHEDSMYYPLEQQVPQVNTAPQWTSNPVENSYVQSPVNVEIQTRSPEPTQAPTNPFRQIYHHYLNQRPGQTSQPVHWTNLWKKYSDSSPPKHESKRYLVIHPDGRTEYVDHIEAVAKKHPNYVLVNAGSYTTHNNNPNLMQTTAHLQNSAPQSTPPHNNNPVPVQPTTDPIDISINEKKLPPILAQQVPEIKQVSAPNDTKTTAAASVISSAPTTQPPITLKKSDQPTQTPVSNLSSTPKKSNVTNPPTTTASTPTKVTTPVNTTQSPATSKETPTSTDKLPSVTPIMPSTSKPASTNTKPKPSSSNTKSPQITPAPPTTTPKSTNTPPTATDKASASTPSSSSIVEATSKPPNSQAKPNNSPDKPSNSPAKSSSQLVKSEAKPKNDKPSTDEKPPKPTKPLTSPPNEPNIPVKPTKPEKPKTTSQPTTTQPPGILDLAKINNSEPITWFKTTDNDVISKLIGDEPYSVVYFIQVKSPAKIEKDTTITVFPNGSKVEEIVETVKDSEDAEPRQTKTVRRIPPENKNK